MLEKVLSKDNMMGVFTKYLPNSRLKCCLLRLRGGKMDMAHRGCPFFPHFFCREGQGFSDASSNVATPYFWAFADVGINLNIFIFSLKMCMHPQLCSFRTDFFCILLRDESKQNEHAYFPPLLKLHQLC